MFQINCHRAGSYTNNAGGGNVGSVHWNTAVNFGGSAGYNYGSLSETHSYGTMASAVGKLPTVLIIL